MIFFESRTSNFLEILFPKLFQFEMYQTKTKVQSIKDICSIEVPDTEDNVLAISVSDILRHISIATIDKILKHVSVTKKQSATNPMRLPKATIGSMNYEYVADITGIVIPMYFEYYLKGHSTIESLVNQKIYDNFVIPNTIDPFLRDFDGDSFILKDQPDDQISDQISEELNHELDHESEKPNLIEHMLKVATKWKAISDGTKYKLNQISKYDWISEVLNNCNKRLSEYLSINSKFETFYEKTTTEPIMIGDSSVYLKLYGYIDVIDKESIWELKCTESIDPIYIIQLILYIYLTEGYNKDHYLFNILTGELYQISVSKVQMKIILIFLLDAKYIYRNKLTSDDEFISKNAFKGI